MRKLNYNIIYLIVIFFLSIIYYYNATQSFFVADDFFYLVNCNNPNLYSPFTYFFYQPITFAFYFLNSFWSGTSFYGYHLFAIVLNAINICILFIIINYLIKNIFYSFFISLFAIVFYVSADNMIWINCTNNIICTFFYFLTILFSIKYNINKSKKYFLIMLINLNLAFYSREMGISLFLILLLVDIIFYIDFKDKKQIKLFIQKHCFIFLFVFIYLCVMAIGPSLRYHKLTFNRGAYELTLSLKDILVNINWFFFRLFIPFSFGSHFKLPLIHSIIQFIRFNYIPIILVFIALSIIRNKYFYFGVFWVLITASPYLLLNMYYVHTGPRYFYLPHMMFGFVLIGIWIKLREFLLKTKLKKFFNYLILIIVILYSTASYLAINKRIHWWIEAGDESYKFINAFKNKYKTVNDYSVFFIKNIPRWSSKSPNKLIVLVTGASEAIRFYYKKNNIKVIPFWDNYTLNREGNIPDLTNYKHFYFLEYKNNVLEKWIPPVKWKRKYIKGK